MNDLGLQKLTKEFEIKVKLEVALQDNYINNYPEGDTSEGKFKEFFINSQQRLTKLLAEYQTKMEACK